MAFAWGKDGFLFAQDLSEGENRKQGIKIWGILVEL